MKKNSISLVMNVKNGENGIERAILSVKGLVSEIIVVDNESTDATTKIATKYTDKIYFSRSRNHFGNIRNFTISKATKEWILILDSDEYLGKELCRIIPTLINQNEIEGYWFSRKNYIKSNKYLKYGLFYPDYQLRLFRNFKRYKFIGKVHAHPNIPEDKSQKINLDIVHKQNPSRLSSFKNYKYLNKYIKNEALELRSKNLNNIDLFYKGLRMFLLMFFGGLIRGKGILDGWDGVRAHFMFASSVFLSYLFATQKESTIRKLLKTYE